MQLLVAGGQLLAGMVTLVLWWMALKLIGGRAKPMTGIRFVVVPSIFLLWLVGGIILVFDGIGLL